MNGEENEYFDRKSLRKVMIGLASGGFLTNLGILLLGSASDRAKPGTAPVVPAIKYDEHGDKRTTLTRAQPHRLRALILEDLERYPDSSDGREGGFANGSRVFTGVREEYVFRRELEQRQEGRGRA